MKTLFSGTAVLAMAAAFSPAVSAADILPEPVFVDPVILAEAPDHTGLYAGLQIGYVPGEFEYPDPFLSNPTVQMFLQSGKGQGGLAGIYAGFNLQIGDRFLIGLEGDLNYIAGGRSDEWLATGRVRAGFFVLENTLAYVTGGVAAGSLNAGGITNDPPYYNPQNPLYASDTGVGFAVGVGLEHWVNANVSIKGEYLYTQLNGVGEFAAQLGDPNDPAPVVVDWAAHTAKVGIAVHL